MSRTKNLLGFGMVGILLLLVIYNPYTNTYISSLKNNEVYVSSKLNKLYEEIEQAAEKYYKAPQNAKIDSTWQAIPGYNGIEVDVKSSFKIMKKEKKFDERKLVFVQKTPEVHLSDLPPAPIYQGHPDKPMVSLFISMNAMENKYLSDMLKTMEMNNVQATFFLEGRWVKKNPDLTRLIVDNGHELGNHSYSHPNMKLLGKKETRSEIVKTNEIIEAITEEKVNWFSPPSRSYHEETIQIAHSLKQRTVMWTIDTIDWKNPTSEQLKQDVLSKVHPGAIILMHPTESSVKALGDLIMELKARNLRIGTVSRLLDEERIIKLQNSEHKQ